MAGRDIAIMPYSVFVEVAAAIRRRTGSEELAVLLQDAAAQHLLGGQPFTAGVVALGFDQVLIDQIKNTGIGIDDLGNFFEFPGNRVARNGGKKVRLAVQFSAHLESLI